MEKKDADKLKGEESPREEPPAKGSPEEPEEKEKVEEKGFVGELPPANFATFVLSLSASALMNLGDIKNPATDKAEKDPVMAKHTIDIIGILKDKTKGNLKEDIDIIGILKDKTKGNLKEDEEKLISNVLRDLRLRYIKVTEEMDKGVKK
jgi:hypothetical protein